MAAVSDGVGSDRTLRPKGEGGQGGRAPWGVASWQARSYVAVLIVATIAISALAWGRSSPVLVHVQNTYTLAALLVAAVGNSLVAVVIDPDVRTGSGVQTMTMQMSGAVSLAAALSLPTRWALLVSATVVAATWARKRKPLVKLVFNACTNALGVSLAALAAGAILSPYETPLQQTASYLAALIAATVLLSMATTGATLWFFYLVFGTFGGSATARAVPADLARDATAGVAVALFAVTPLAVILVIPVAVPAIGDLRGRYFENSSRLDSKTRLANPATVMDGLEREVARATRRKASLCAVMIDVDNFRDINRRYGHVRADAALVQLASTLTAAARTGDITGRWGGDELIWVMPGTVEHEALAAVERFRRAVEMECLPFGEGGHVVTVSAGVASWDEDMTIENLLGNADAALYSAKEAGRNIILAWTPAPAR